MFLIKLWFIYVGVPFSSTSLTATCNDGYKPVDLHLGTNLNQPWTQNCTDGDWPKPAVPVAGGPGVTSSLNEIIANGPKKCVPICTPPCINGGKCVKPNECECTADFEGPNCQNRKPKNCSGLPVSVTKGYAVHRWEGSRSSTKEDVTHNS